MADVAWMRYPSATLSGPPGEEYVTLSGLPKAYPMRGERRAIAREFLGLRVAGDVERFCARWGPAFSEWERAQDGVIDGRVPPVESVQLVLGWAEALRDARHAALTRAAEGGEPEILALVQEVPVRFAPGAGLVPQLVPMSLLDLVAIAVLEEVRSIGPVLVCLNWPASGCRQVVPDRRGPRGRRPLYCSPECAARARSQRSYARRRATKGGH